MKFTRNKSLLQKLIVVDGVAKCGKALFLNVISSFDTVEKWNFNECLEFIGFAYSQKKISEDMALAILRTEMDTALYNNMIGRGVNMRLSDDTSLYNYHSPEKYLKRSLEAGGPAIYEKILAEKPIYLCWTHDLIHKSDIVFKAFAERLIFIYINRDPIDMIYEWGCAEYSDRMAKDPTEMQYCIQYKNTMVPQIAYGWEAEYLNCGSMERTVKLVYCFMKYNSAALLKKKALSNLHVFNFEDLLSDPLLIVTRLTSIIGTKPLPNIMEKVLRQVHCPRKINNSVRQIRKTSILEKISQSYADLIIEMEAIYADIKNLSYACANV